MANTGHVVAYGDDPYTQAAIEKITIEAIKRHLHGIGDQHHVQPKVISISQSTEMGTVYSPQEIKTIANYAHENQMLLHLDGARLSNAAASLEVDLKTLTADVGV